MGERTGIAWCDHTFNPWIGCTKVSAGCEHCYAEAEADKRYGLVEWGPNGQRRRTRTWRQLMKWDREAGDAGVRRRVFCASWADVFERRDELDPWRKDLFELMRSTKHLDWLLLTKRPENVPGILADLTGFIDWFDGQPQYWIGTSVEDQATADKRIPALLRIPAAIRFLSVEPLLGPVDLAKWLPPGRAAWQCQTCGAFDRFYRTCPFCESPREYLTGSHAANKRTEHGWVNRQPLDWIIIGGESGPKARRCDVAWVRSIVRQCKAAGVACFVKQLGSRPCMGKSEYGVEVGPLKTIHPKGGDPAEWPEDLQVREFPEA